MHKPLLYLFGGSFNPPHRGHIEPLLALQQQYNVGTITLLPNHISPLKLNQPPVSNAHRLAMLQLCTAQYPTLTISDYELTQSETSFTINTLMHFCEEYRVFFIIGEDSLQSLDKWYRYVEIMQLCHIIVLPRNTEQSRIIELPEIIVQNMDTLSHGPIPHKTSCITRVTLPRVNISSTQCRLELANHDIESQYITPSVLNYIRRHHLFAN
ncbi:MAG: nicotinate (nicotinamide) nucleotide adenylyltransferase [Glaciecola sp.]|nr:nicotinate (nicotinamide) nucleotide adenylyltransferase [Glaciecola sp.]MDG2098128.1 nicotinate (nicotinamide) nucleotide adenylyltransferase [Glaciecola sp.]